MADTKRLKETAGRRGHIMHVITEQDLQNIIRVNLGAMVLCKFDGQNLTTVYTAPALATISGYIPVEYDQLTRTDAGVLVLKQDRDLILTALSHVLVTEKDQEYAFRVLHKTRSFIWLKARARLLGTYQGKPLIKIVLQDASTAAKEYAGILDKVNSLIYVIDATTHELLYANKYAREAWGCDNYTGRICHELVMDRQDLCPWCPLTSFTEQLSSLPPEQAIHAQVTLEECYVAKFKKWFKAEYQYSNWFGRQGIIVYAVDITVEKEKQLTAAKNGDEVIKRITDSKCDYTAIIDTENNSFELLSVNRVYSEYPLHVQLNYHQNIAKSCRNFVAPEDRVFFQNSVYLPTINKMLQDNNYYTFTYNILEQGKNRRKQLEYTWFGKPGGKILCFQTDVTTAFEHEREQIRKMAAAMDSANAANKAKSEFLNRLSHDIRTPMNIIQNMTDFALADLQDQEKLKDDLHKIKSANAFLLSLINDILDISKIESGNISLHLEPYPFQEYAQAIEDIIVPLCRSKNLQLQLHPGPVEGTIMADRVRLNQILLNLVSNAVKYTPAGGKIDLSFSSQKQPGHKLLCTLTVKDTGIGMRPEFLAHLGEPFAQDASPARSALQVSGTGLGLAIVKRILDLIGGTMTVQSKLGQGTEIKVQGLFSEAPNITAITTTQDIPGKSLSAYKTAHNAQPPNILVAEDNAINAEIIKRLLEAQAYHVELAQNGAEALRLFQSHHAGTYQAILMDIRMPILDGYEATKAIRAQKQADAKTIPILALSANAYAEDIENAQAAGMNGHIAKPINPQILRTELERILSL